jgi:hypothetical protein
MCSARLPVFMKEWSESLVLPCCSVQQRGVAAANVASLNHSGCIAPGPEGSQLAEIID